MNTDDPIFAAIEAHRQAEVTYAAAGGEMSDESFGELGAASFERLVELLPMTPTTVVGCAAMLRHVAEYLSAYDRNLFEGYRDDVEGPGGTLLIRIAGALEKAEDVQRSSALIRPS